MLDGLRTRLASAIRPKAAAASMGVLPLWWDYYGGGIMDTAAGVEVSPLIAYYRCTPVYAAIKVLAESIAQLPLHLYSRDNEGSKKRELNHPIADILEHAPNEYMTAFEFRLKMMENLLLFGNAYAEIVRDRTGRVAELWWIPSERVAVEINLDTLAPVYRITDAGNNQRLLGIGDILHIKTLGHRYYLGESPIMMNKGAIALMIAMEEHASRIFGQGAKPSGVLQTSRVLSPESTAQLRTQFDSTFGGRNSARTVVLEEGMEWKAAQFNSVDTQFFELRKWQLSEVARIYRIPLILLQDFEKTSQNNTETLGRQFVSMTLQPWLTCWEQAISLSLLSPDERRQFYPRFDLSDFTRADTLARYQAWVAGVTNGLLSPNEVRSWENLPPYEGGDDFHRPLNTGKAAGTPATQGQLSHVVSPTETMTPALTLQSRQRLETYLSRSPNRLRLTARPSAATVESDPNPQEEPGYARDR